MAVFRRPDEDSASGRVSTDSRTSSSDPEETRLGSYLVGLLRRHRGKLLGTLIGLWVGFGVMALGVWWTLFISLAVGIGYFIGKRLDENQENFWDFLDRVLPPGRG